MPDTTVRKDMPSASRPLHRFAQLVVLATFCLIFAGGLVTSKGAGLAVPDWPTTFGYNMFLYPVSKWQGGIFFEHVHRLVASLIGLLTIVLTVWIWRKEQRTWVKRLSLGAFVLVVAQGVMGGLRVTELSIVLAMIHGCTAQLFLCVLILISAALSPAWIAGGGAGSLRPLLIRRLAWLLVASVCLQLIIGAVMRHAGAGLAIQTFPKSTPDFWMPTVHNFPTDIHFGHRIVALWVTLVALALVVSIFTWARNDHRLVGLALAITGLLSFQITLGAHIIWLMRPPLTTTLHVLNGAVILGTALLIALRASRLGRLSPVRDAHAAVPGGVPA
jgi:heme a synthase